MRTTYKLKKGLNIPLKGYAAMCSYLNETGTLYEIKPTDFHHITPKLLVREGDAVLAGSPVFCDKSYPQMVCTSPVSGTISSIVRKEKRRLAGIRIVPDNKEEKVTFAVVSPESLDQEKIKELLLASGCWMWITRRPYGTPARPTEQPLHIYISCFDTAPLAPNYDYAFADEEEALKMGLRVMERLCPGRVHLWLSD